VLTKDSGTDHLRVNLWLTLYKLTGWLASLDTTKTISVASSTKTISAASSATERCPHALFDVLVLDRERGEIMNDCYLHLCIPPSLPLLRASRGFPGPQTRVLCCTFRAGYARSSLLTRCAASSLPSCMS